MPSANEFLENLRDDIRAEDGLVTDPLGRLSQNDERLPIVNQNDFRAYTVDTQNINYSATDGALLLGAEAQPVSTGDSMGGSGSPVNETSSHQAGVAGMGPGGRHKMRALDNDHFKTSPRNLNGNRDSTSSAASLQDFGAMGNV